MQSLPAPQAHGHEVLIRVEACGLNAIDAKMAL
jgi:NADPH:quinone reductase-like Zn-dependent oxidoreductase